MKLLRRLESGFELDQAERELRAARVAALRRTHWQELRESDLVRRGIDGCWLVDEPSDRIFRVTMGAIFAPGRAAVEFASPDDSHKAFYVTADDRVVVLDRVRYPTSYSEFEAQQAAAQ